MNAPDPEANSWPIKDITGKNYTFSFGPYKHHKVWEIMGGNPAIGMKADPTWLLENDGLRFNLSARIRDEIKESLSAPNLQEHKS